jgi:hypothetical protein
MIPERGNEGWPTLEWAHIHTFVRAGAIAMVTGQRDLIRDISA